MVDEVRGGRRKGRDPVGEAWFVDGRVRKSMLASRRTVYGTGRDMRVLAQRETMAEEEVGGEGLCVHTCHFRQPGLKLGRPRRASESVEKMYSVGRLLEVRCCDLSGRWFGS